MTSTSSVAVVANIKKLDPKDASRLRLALAEAGTEAGQWLSIDHGSDAKAATAKAVQKGAKTVIVCGGDGTVRAAAEALVGTETALAVVPAGTANLFATGLHLPTDIDQIVEAVTHGDRRTIDTAACNGRTFNVMAGAGFDVRFLAHAEEEKDRLGMMAYLRAGVDEARNRSLFDATVTVDGLDFFEGEASCVLVGKLGATKGGIETFPEATPTDGRLHVAVLTAAGLREWAGLLTSAVLHRQHSSSMAEITEGAEVKVKFDSKQRFELDGGVKGKAKKLYFDVLPRSLVVCCSSLN